MDEKLIQEFNTLGISDMPEVTQLYPLKGEFINLEYPLPSGRIVKFWEDSKTYYGNQLEKAGSSRCYGLAADETYLMVCEYGEDGSDAEIVVFKRRN